MKIIISAGNTKREIEGPFAICVSKDDLDWIKTCLNASEPFYFGWIFITDKPKILSNCSPKKWDEQ